MCCSMSTMRVQAVKKNKKLAKARIDTWKEFLKHNPVGEKIICHHVFVPFKKEEAIKKHIIQAISSKGYGSGSYNEKDNCQHFVNRCLLSLNISNEATA